MQYIEIVVLCVVVAVSYGILHDQVTARICIEYFTIGHAPIFGTQDPTLLALGWGVLATWWAAVMLGVPLAFVPRFGRRPKRTVGSLVRPLVTLMIVSFALAAIAGTLGAAFASAGIVTLIDPLAAAVP